MIDIALLATGAWNVLQPYVPVLATKAVAEISKKVPEAVNKVWDAIKKRFESKPETAGLPADLAKNPESPVVQGAYQYQLQKLLETDEAFARQLDALVKEAKQVIQQTATLTGDGAIAQGNGAVALGKGAVHIGGKVTGNINTGTSSVSDDKKKKKR